jgi:hypothetical protein
MSTFAYDNKVPSIDRHEIFVQIPFPANDGAGHSTGPKAGARQIYRFPPIRFPRHLVFCGHMTSGGAFGGDHAANPQQLANGDIVSVLVYGSGLNGISNNHFARPVQNSALSANQSPVQSATINFVVESVDNDQWHEIHDSYIGNFTGQTIESLEIEAKFANDGVLCNWLSNNAVGATDNVDAAMMLLKFAIYCEPPSGNKPAHAGTYLYDSKRNISLLGA